MLQPWFLSALFQLVHPVHCLARPGYQNMYMDYVVMALSVKKK